MKPNEATADEIRQTLEAFAQTSAQVLKLLRMLNDRVARMEMAEVLTATERGGLCDRLREVVEVHQAVEGRAGLLVEAMEERRRTIIGSN